MSDIFEFTAPQEAYNGTTKGDFLTELEAEDYFCGSAAVLRWFVVKRQVQAKPLFSHPVKTQNKERYRFDVLLFPGGDLINLGWTHGAVAIECKKSGVKVGPGFSQALDYVNSCAIGLDDFGGVLTIPSFAFLFPSKTDGGPVASLQTQNRIGCAFEHDNGLWEFYSGHTLVCKFDFYNFFIGCTKAGNKTGSR
jgi:hypothetical protein